MAPRTNGWILPTARSVFPTASACSLYYRCWGPPGSLFAIARPLSPKVWRNTGRRPSNSLRPNWRSETRSFRRQRRTCQRGCSPFIGPLPATETRPMGDWSTPEPVETATELMWTVMTSGRGCAVSTLNPIRKSCGTFWNQVERSIRSSARASSSPIADLSPPEFWTPSRKRV